jgi:phage shock protein A
MTKNKRFKNVEENLEWGTVQYFTYYDEKITDKELEKLVNHLLNQNDGLTDENEQLKTQLQNTSDQRDEFHRAARENANRVGKLEKENEQLKERLKMNCPEFVWRDLE